MTRFFMISLLGHLFIFLSTISFSEKKSVLEKNVNLFIPSYVSTSKQITSPKGIVRKKSSPIQQHSNSQLSFTEKNSDDQLIQILHKLISEKQVYPNNALDAGQSGTVTIGLLMTPNGDISDVKILRSSGFDSIDLAALDAVQSISPIQEAKDLLQKERFFSVNVIFEIE